MNYHIPKEEGRPSFPRMDFKYLHDARPFSHGSRVTGNGRFRRGRQSSHVLKSEHRQPCSYLSSIVLFRKACSRSSGIQICYPIIHFSPSYIFGMHAWRTINFASPNPLKTSQPESDDIVRVFIQAHQACTRVWFDYGSPRTSSACTYSHRLQFSVPTPSPSPSVN